MKIILWEYIIMMEYRNKSDFLMRNIGWDDKASLVKGHYSKSYFLMRNFGWDDKMGWGVKINLVGGL